MKLISAFPVDSITFMFSMEIHHDTLLCLLVLVKKIIKGKIVTLLSWGAPGSAVVTLLAQYF